MHFIESENFRLGGVRFGRKFIILEYSPRKFLVYSGTVNIFYKRFKTKFCQKLKKTKLALISISFLIFCFYF